MKSAHVIVIFLDIRGFTKWSESTKSVRYMDSFIGKFYSYIQEKFSGFYQKKLGDGVMIVQELSEEPSLKIAKLNLKEILVKIKSTDEWFTSFCNQFSQDYALKMDLSLGWGVVRGDVNKIENESDSDYLGADVNRTSRLCGVARPYGVVIDKCSFSELPEEFASDFYEQTYRLKGISDAVEVYVSESIKEQLTPREEKRETPEVHVAGSCFRKEGEEFEILLAKRSPDRSIYPNLFEGCGGQLSKNEFFTDGVRRHYLKEMGIEVEVKENFHTFYRIDLHEEPLIPGIRFLCEYKKGDPQSQKHTEIRWVLQSELEKMDESLFPPGFKQQTCELLQKYQEKLT